MKFNQNRSKHFTENNIKSAYNYEYSISNVIFSEISSILLLVYKANSVQSRLFAKLRLMIKRIRK